MNGPEKFLNEVEENISSMSRDNELKSRSLDWINAIVPHKYVYNFAWMGRPVIQLPQDIVAVQELIWDVKPDLVIETGIAHGGSLVLSASILALLDYCDALEKGELLDPNAPKRRVLGIDIDIRRHNREAIETHPMSNRISMIEGSSVDQNIVDKVHSFSAQYQRIMVFLDSNHTHEHVLKELQAYAPLTSKESYCVVFDTVIEDLDDKFNVGRPWGKGDNAKTAVHEFLKNCETPVHGFNKPVEMKFERDKKIENKLLLTVAPDGFLRRVK